VTVPEEWFAPQVSYNVNQGVTWVSVMDSREPDPRWKFTDAAGHEHAYDEDDKTPTLKAVIIADWWCATCNDEHDDVELQCAQCGEAIVPGTRAGPDRIAIPGVREVYLENVPLTAAEQEELRTAGWLDGDGKRAEMRVINGKPQWDRVYLTSEEATEFLAECQQRGKLPAIRGRIG
jgi:hypothetical protein